MQCVDGNLTGAIRSFDLNDSVECHQRYAEIGRVRGDAMLAPAEHGMKTILAVTRIAARTRRTPIAGAREIVEIGATRALHQIAANGRRIAELCRGARKKRFGDRGEGSRKAFVVGEVRVAHQCADANAAVSKPLDPIKAAQPCDVDDTRGPCNTHLHQVEQIGAGGEVDRSRLGCGRQSLLDACRANIVETVHAASFRLLPSSVFCASSTASVMP